MLRISLIVGVSLFLLSHVMLFLSRQHDPINASVMIFASIFVAVGTLRYFGVPCAAPGHYLGTFFWISGWMSNALIYFDIMSLGYTAPFEHQSKISWSLPSLLLVAGAGSYWLWSAQNRQNQPAVAITVLGCTLLFFTSRQFFQHPILVLASALALAAGLLWHSFQGTGEQKRDVG